MVSKCYNYIPSPFIYQYHTCSCVMYIIIILDQLLTNFLISFFIDKHDSCNNWCKKQDEDTNTFKDLPQGKPRGKCCHQLLTMLWSDIQKGGGSCQHGIISGK